MRGHRDRLGREEHGDGGRATQARCWDRATGTGAGPRGWGAGAGMGRQDHADRLGQGHGGGGQGHRQAGTGPRDGGRATQTGWNRATGMRPGKYGQHTEGPSRRKKCRLSGLQSLTETPDVLWWGGDGVSKGRAVASVSGARAFARHPLALFTYLVILSQLVVHPFRPAQTNS